MEIDLIEEEGRVRKPVIAVVDDAHPFDLESYISNYTGRTAIDRLVHIISICPSIAPEAFHLAVRHIYQSRDPTHFQALLAAYERAASAVQGCGVELLPDALGLASIDSAWVDEVTAQNQAERMKLEVELKTYSNNMIKESIRMAHRDLGDYYRAVGDHAASLKHYTRSREFCTTSQHVLEMALSVIELLLERSNYTNLTTYIFKAEAALDASAATTTAPLGTSAPSGSITVKKKTPERDPAYTTKLELATALAHLGQSAYEKAAVHFLMMGPYKDLGHWIGKLVAPGDIAVYAILCALATYSRSAIKSQILENSTFGLYMEQESYLRELIDAYMRSNFKTVLDLLARYSTRHYVDIHLAPHMQRLTTLITNRAVALYFQPFATIKLERMSATFGWTVEEVENHLIELIDTGEIQGRIDSQNKILKANKTDHRSELYARALKTAQDMQNTNRKVLLRMQLQQAELLVKAAGKAPHYAADYAAQVMGDA